MNPVSIYYRGKQFWNALRGNPSKERLTKARELLNPEQMTLFMRMQPGEQAHSLAVMQHIADQSEDVPENCRDDLLVAALLHDVGKSKYPLWTWERVLVVLMGALSPALMRRLGEGDPISWKRAFVVAQMHAEWGADMAIGAGTSPLAVELIRNHQNFLEEESVSYSNMLLEKLQAADGNY